MFGDRPRHPLALAACLWLAATAPSKAQEASTKPFAWPTATPASQGMDAKALESVWDGLKESRTTAFLVIRRDRVVFERYGEGYSRTKPHGTASRL